MAVAGTQSAKDRKDGVAIAKPANLLERIIAEEEGYRELRRLLKECTLRVSAVEEAVLEEPERDAVERPSALSPASWPLPPAPVLRTVLIGPTGPRQNPFQGLLQARLPGRGGPFYLLGQLLPSSMPSLRIEVESDQSDIGLLVEGLDPVFEAPEIHWQALTRNTQGQGCSERKRVLVRTNSTQRNAVKAADPSLRCLQSIFGAGFQVACLKGENPDDMWNPCGWSVTQTALDAGGGQRCTVLLACAGHGPLSHILSSRVSQSLPAYTLQQLRLGPDELDGLLLSEVLQQAFQWAESDIESMAPIHQLDLGMSCVAAAMVVHVPPDPILHCAWAGDVQIAVIDEQEAAVSVMQMDGHVMVGEEAKRVTTTGAYVVDGPAGMPPRMALASPDESISQSDLWASGLPCTRALGASWAADLGVVWMPEYAKLEASPGASVVLAAGSVCGGLSVEEIFELKTSGESRGPPDWADRICEESRQRRMACGAGVDSSTCLIWSVPSMDRFS
mmetsp:Transcript_41701/g.75731  ORF Transcript_41701/g.75731 Transcript_41701/m.75731 type:complete len:504 (+) Transcript_41701:58-1569(+)